MSEEHPPSLPKSATASIFAPAYHWWLRVRRETGRLPRRSDLDPTDLTPKALPYVMMIDIDPDLQKLRWRLMGTAHVALNKKDLTGTLLEDAYPPNSSSLPYVKGLYAQMIGERRPIWSINDIAHPSHSLRMTISRLMLPLSSDTISVDLCVAIQLVTYSDPGVEDPPILWNDAHYAEERERCVL